MRQAFIPVIHSILNGAVLIDTVLCEYPIHTPLNCKLYKRGLNDTYLVETESEKYILRVYRLGWRNKEEIDFELAILTFLHEQNQPVAYPITRKDGSLTTEINAPEGTRYAVVFYYAPGHAMNEKLDARQSYILGESLAKIHICLDDFQTSFSRPLLKSEYLLDWAINAISSLYKHRAEDIKDLQKQVDNIKKQINEFRIPLSAPDYGICVGDVHSGNAHFTKVTAIFDLYFFMNTLITTQLPIPPHFNSETVGAVWRVPYQQRAAEAQAWAKKHDIKPASEDKIRICLLLIDVQNTFCIPEFELFVGGKSGTGAVDDNTRLCEFIYRNLGGITKIIPTLDTHTSMQIFHPIFWINTVGEHPIPAATNIIPADIEKGIWKVNPSVAFSLGYDYEFLEKHAYHYVKRLTQDGKYPLTVWPYHSMLGGIGHALVSAVEEAIFFHCMARNSQTQFEIKGNNPLTENYSILRPEVLEGFNNRPIAEKNTSLIQHLLDFDAVIITGQAKSHCVAWTIDDLLTEIRQVDINLAQKVYLLEDCTSPVVVPGVIDYTESADEAFERFADAGMHIVKSTDSLF